MTTARDGYEDDYSGYMNEVLYRICEEKPYHESVDIVAAKFQIIGRCYAAALDRGAGDNFDYDLFAKRLIESGAGKVLDAHINALKEISRIELGNVTQLLETHCMLAEKLKEFTKSVKNPEGATKRSLASKYLHFHAPSSVFIFDSISNANVPKRPESKLLKAQISDLRVKHDLAYAIFVFRVLEFRRDAETKRAKGLLTPRRLDALLYESDYIENNKKPHERP